MKNPNRKNFAGEVHDIIRILMKKEAVQAVINYRRVLADKLSFDYIDEKIQAKFDRYKIVDTDFQIFVNDHYDEQSEIPVVNDSILYYCIGFVFDEATNGSEFPFLLNDAEFVLTRANAMRYASEICELEGETIEKYIDFGIDYAKRRVCQLPPTYRSGACKSLVD